MIEAKWEEEEEEEDSGGGCWNGSQIQNLTAIIYVCQNSRGSGVCEKVEANDAVTVAGMTKPKLLPHEVLSDLGVSAATKLQCYKLRTIEAANGLMLKLRAQLEPFRCIADDMITWEEKSAAVRLASKMEKSKRNKL
ncbi:hypothetical protein ACFE04_000189 [Oxalis oulophora]